MCRGLDSPSHCQIIRALLSSSSSKYIHIYGINAHRQRFYYTKFRPFFFVRESGNGPLKWLLARFLWVIVTKDSIIKSQDEYCWYTNLFYAYNCLRFGNVERKSGIDPSKLLLWKSLQINRETLMRVGKWEGTFNLIIYYLFLYVI